MKTAILNTDLKKIFAGVIATIMLLGFNSCAKKTSSATVATETATPMIAEEKGEMLVKRDASSNYVIQINIADLEPVKKLQPAKEAYVVWMVTDMKTTKNLGQIEGANTWLSKKDKASFEAVTPSKPTKIFITAENDAAAQKPGTQIVWSTKTF